MDARHYPNHTANDVIKAPDRPYGRSDLTDDLYVLHVYGSMVILFLSILGKYLSVFFASMFKFIGGPTMGIAFGLTFWETAIITVLGMMTSVVVVSTFGRGFRKWLDKIFRRNRKKFTKRNRRFVTLWRKYGLFGVSFLTPVVFSPVIGALLVNAFGDESKKKIITYMLISAVFWSFLLTKFSYLIPEVIQ